MNMKNVENSSRCLRPAIVAGQLGIGGTERQICGLVKHFEDFAVKPIVICMSSRIHPFGEMIRSSGITFFSMNHEAEGAFRRLELLIDIIKSEDAEIIHSFGDAAGVFSTFASRRLKLPHIHSVRSHTCGCGPLRKFMRSQVIRRADLITVNSEHLLQSVMRSRALSPDKVFLTPNGVVPSEIMNKDRNGKATVLYVGRDHPSKDIPTLVNLIRYVDGECMKEYPRFVLMGRGLKNATRSISGRLTNVELCTTGEVVDIDRWLRESDILVHTSRSEGMPNAVLEAMAAGLPVVATSAGGTAELISNGHDGYLVEKGDHRCMAKRLKMLLEDEQLRKLLGGRARKTIAEKFSFEKTCKIFHEIYCAC